MKQKDTKQTRIAADTPLLFLYFIAACVYISLALTLNVGEWLLATVSLAFCLIGTAVLARIAGSFKRVLGYSMIILIFVFFGGSLLPVGLLAAFTSAVCVYTYLLLRRPSPFLWGIGAVPLVISVLVVKSMLAAILSLAPLPCALLLAYSVKKGFDRVRSVCYLSFGICLPIVLCFIAAINSIYGEVSFAVAKSLIDALREQIVLTLSAVSDQMTELVDLGSADMSSYIVSAVNAAFNLLPAILITLANLIAYMIHSAFLSIYCKDEETRTSALPMLAFDMSLTSAIVFILSLICALALVSDSTALWRTAAENMLVILAPGLILTALGALRMLTSIKGPSCLGTLVYLFVIFMLVSFSLPAILITATAGAVVIILAHVSKKGKSHNSDD